MMNKNFSHFIGCESDYREAAVVLFGAPFDSTTSYRPGARFGSAAIRNESFGIESYSPYQQRDLAECAVFDGGDLELPFGDPSPALAAIEAQTEEILTDGKLPLLLGGEHLVTLGAVRAITKKYPDLCILHFDAHADLRADYLGQKLSHATVMRRIWELVGDGRIFQFGIRSGDKSEWDFAQGHVITCPFDLSGLKDALAALGDIPVYVTIDMDVLDPSVFPGTGTPEAGGVSFATLLEAVYALSGLHIVGADLVELAPNYDPSGISTAAACKLTRELLLVMSK